MLVDGNHILKHKSLNQKDLQQPSKKNMWTKVIILLDSVFSALVSATKGLCLCYPFILFFLRAPSSHAWACTCRINSGTLKHYFELASQVGVCGNESTYLIFIFFEEKLSYMVPNSFVVYEFCICHEIQSEISLQSTIIVNAELL